MLLATEARENSRSSGSGHNDPSRRGGLPQGQGCVACGCACGQHVIDDDGEATIQGLDVRASSPSAKSESTF